MELLYHIFREKVKGQPPKTLRPVLPKKPKKGRNSGKNRCFYGTNPESLPQKGNNPIIFVDILQKSSTLKKIFHHKIFGG